jgi:hypothetical protein
MNSQTLNESRQAVTEYNDRYVEQITELWASGAADCNTCGTPFCESMHDDSTPAENELYMRLSGGIELTVSHTSGKPIGGRYTGLWTVRAYRFGEVFHTIPALVTLSPSTHYDAGRSAINTLRCAGLIGVDNVES